MHNFEFYEKLVKNSLVILEIKETFLLAIREQISYTKKQFLKATKKISKKLVLLQYKCLPVFLRPAVPNLFLLTYP